MKPENLGQQPLPQSLDKPTSRRAQVIIIVLVTITCAVVGIVWSWQTNQSRYMASVTVSVGEEETLNVPGYSPPYRFSYSVNSSENSGSQLTVTWVGPNIGLVDPKPLTGYANVKGLHINILEVNDNFVVFTVIGP